MVLNLSPIIFSKSSPIQQGKHGMLDVKQIKNLCESVQLIRANYVDTTYELKAKAGQTQYWWAL